MELVSPAWGPAVGSKHGLTWVSAFQDGCVRFCVTTWSHHNSVFISTDSQAMSRAPYRESGCALHCLAAQKFFICSWHLSISLPEPATLAFSMAAMPILCAQHQAFSASSRCSCPLGYNNSVAWAPRFPGSPVGAEDPWCFAVLGTLLKDFFFQRFFGNVKTSNLPWVGPGPLGTFPIIPSQALSFPEVAHLPCPQLQWANVPLLDDVSLCTSSCVSFL